MYSKTYNSIIIGANKEESAEFQKEYFPQRRIKNRTVGKGDFTSNSDSGWKERYFGIIGKYGKQVQNVLYTVLDTMVRLLTPIIPHTMDELYEAMGGSKLSSVLLTMPARSEVNANLLEIKFRDSIIICDEDFLSLKNENIF